MNKADLIEAITERVGDKKTANTAVEAVVDAITRAVATGEKVAITGFGVFEKVDRAARTARNPATGATVKLKKTSVPKFRPGQGFKDVVSGAKKLAAVSRMTPTRATAAKAAPAKRATATKAAPAAKATAAKATPAKRATAAKAAPAKRATASPASKATAASKSTASKAASSKSAAGRTLAANASKAPAKRTAAATLASKAPAAKRTPAKKASR